MVIQDESLMIGKASWIFFVIVTGIANIIYLKFTYFLYIYFFVHSFPFLYSKNS